MIFFITVMKIVFFFFLTEGSS